MFPRLSILLLTLGALSLSAAGRPSWAETTDRAASNLRIEWVVEASAHDLVVLDGGLAAGIRRGMVVEARRGADSLGRLLVAEASADRAVALILELEPAETLVAGDRIVRSIVRL